MNPQTFTLAMWLSIQLIYTYILSDRRILKSRPKVWKTSTLPLSYYRKFWITEYIFRITIYKFVSFLVAVCNLQDSFLRTEYYFFLYHRSFFNCCKYSLSYFVENNRIELFPCVCKTQTLPLHQFSIFEVSTRYDLVTHPYQGRILPIKN